MNRYLDIEPWAVVERGFHPEFQRSSESIFSLGNGRFGQRANFEEGYTGDHMLGSYVGGVYYPDRTKVGWWKNGYPEYFAKVLNATNWTHVGIAVNGVTLDLHDAREVKDFERRLDMQGGILTRTCSVVMADGAEVRLETERFCSMANPNRAAIRVVVTPLNGVTSLTFAPTRWRHHQRRFELGRCLLAPRRPPSRCGQWHCCLDQHHGKDGVCRRNCASIGWRGD